MLPLLLAILTLPDESRTALDRRYPGWQPAPVAAQVQEWFAERAFRFAPNLATADFNGDGRPDWAVSLIHAGRQIAAVVVSGAGVHELMRDTPDGFTFLLLAEKGERDFDFRTLKHFRHVRDSITVMPFSGSPLRFTWRRGRFTNEVVPNDEE